MTRRDTEYRITPYETQLARRTGNPRHNPSHPSQDIPRLAYSPDEAARTFGVSRDFLDEHIAGELRWVRRGRRKLVAVAELRRWLDENQAVTLGEAP